MKPHIKKRFLVPAVLSLLVLAVFSSAQEPPARGRLFGPAGPRPGNPPDPQQMLQQHLDRLASHLNLTDTQKSQAAAIFGDAVKAAQPVHQRLRETRKSLQDAVRANNVEQIDQLSNMLGTLVAQGTSIVSKAEAQFIATLTPDQKAKLPDGPFGLLGGPGFGGLRRPPPAPNQ